MREIIFRGKRLDNGEWVYGWPFADTADCSLKKVGKCVCPHDGSEYFIVEWVDDFHEYEEREVIPDTVGQYTGLNDKNGQRIFEGDIVKADNGAQSSISVVKFGEYYPKMFYDMLDMFMPGIPHLNANGFYAVSTKHEDMILFKSLYFEVIGNIHDNKSLLNNQEAGE